ELLDMEIESMLSFFLGLTSTKALEYLGVPLKEGKEADKNLEKARLSIDVTSFIVDKLEPFVGSEEQKQLKQVVSELQFAFFRESN
ncbi:MAG: DUF1844 domain-containing protein, partial [bacterium]